MQVAVAAVASCFIIVALIGSSSWCVAALVPTSCPTTHHALVLHTVFPHVSLEKYVLCQVHRNPYALGAVSRCERLSLCVRSCLSATADNASCLGAECKQIWVFTFLVVILGILLSLAACLGATRLLSAVPFAVVMVSIPVFGAVACAKAQPTASRERWSQYLFITGTATEVLVFVAWAVWMVTLLSSSLPWLRSCWYVHTRCCAGTQLAVKSAHQRAPCSRVTSACARS